MLLCSIPGLTSWSFAFLSLGETVLCLLPYCWWFFSSEVYIFMTQGFTLDTFTPFWTISFIWTIYSLPCLWSTLYGLHIWNPSQALRFCPLLPAASWSFPPAPSAFHTSVFVSFLFDSPLDISMSSLHESRLVVFLISHPLISSSTSKLYLSPMNSNNLSLNNSPVSICSFLFQTQNLW